MPNENPYTGPETEEAYHAWLDKEYPFWRQAPIFSTVTVHGSPHVVVGYCLLDDKPAVKLSPKWIADGGDYNAMCASATNVHLSCLEANVH